MQYTVNWPAEYPPTPPSLHSLNTFQVSRYGNWTVCSWVGEPGGKNNFFKFNIAIYNLLNIDRVISKVELREGHEAGIIHQWFTGVLLLS